MAVPRTHEEAAAKNRRGQQSLDKVHESKRQAALKDPGADRSRENAARAAREWRKSG